MEELLVRALLAWVAAASAIAFGLAVADKRAARRGRARVRERTLLLWALVGGSPGLVAGMLLARHKTRKASFLARVGLILAAQAATVFAALRL